MSNVALVLEGGGYRGLFTSGAIDILSEQGLTGFSSIWGTSAGAINGANFKARMPGRFLRDCLAFRDDRRFMSLFALATTGSIAGNDFTYGEVQHDIDPFDFDSFTANPSKMYAVCTDVVFGTAAYLEVRDARTDTDRVMASASLPGMSEIVDIEGHRYLDGGTADSIAVDKALESGADKAVVVLTQDRSYIKHNSAAMAPVVKRMYADFPYYLDALGSRPERYNAQREHIWELEREGKIVVIAPDTPVTMGSTGGSGEDMLRLYVQGRKQMLGSIEAVRDLLS